MSVLFFISYTLALIILKSRGTGKIKKLIFLNNQVKSQHKFVTFCWVTCGNLFYTSLLTGSLLYFRKILTLHLMMMFLARRKILLKSFLKNLRKRALKLDLCQHGKNIHKPILLLHKVVIKRLGGFAMVLSMKGFLSISVQHGYFLNIVERICC